MARRIETAILLADGVQVEEFVCSDPCMRRRSDYDNVAELLADLMEEGYWLTHVKNTVGSHAYKYILVKSEE